MGQDYSTMTEVADALVRDAGVAFRTAHASALTDHCRAQGLKTAALSDLDIARIFQETTGRELPVEPHVIREALDPVAMIQNRKGFGGPQPDEIQRSLARHLQATRLELHALFLALHGGTSN